MQQPACGGGCAVAALTIRAEAAAANDELRQVAHAALASWTDQLTERLTTSGLGPARPATSPSP